MEGLIFYLMIWLIISFIFGGIAVAVAKKRGIHDEGFLWGFFFWGLGVIVMRICPRI